MNVWLLGESPEARKLKVFERVRLREKQREFGFEGSGGSRELKTEGFRACPASREAERIRFRRKQRKLGFEGSGENSASREAKEAEEIFL